MKYANKSAIKKSQNMQEKNANMQNKIHKFSELYCDIFKNILINN
jgi:hypothetical protein